MKRDVCPEHRFKIKFSTKKAAMTAMNKSFAADGTVLSIYKCPACRCWHLTSQKKRPSK